MNQASAHNTDDFLTELLRYRTPQEMKKFLEGILTPKELVEIPVRLQIVKLLKAGHSQRAIAQQLNIGIATVTRGARELRLGRFQRVQVEKKTAPQRAT